MSDSIKFFNQLAALIPTQSCFKFHCMWNYKEAVLSIKDVKMYLFCATRMEPIHIFRRHICLFTVPLWFVLSLGFGGIFEVSLLLWLCWGFGIAQSCCLFLWLVAGGYQGDVFQFLCYVWSVGYSVIWKRREKKDETGQLNGEDCISDLYFTCKQNKKT